MNQRQMNQRRNASDVLEKQLFMADGGLETTLIFHEKIDLPYFAAFDLLKDEVGTRRLHQYYCLYAEMARSHGLGLLLEAPTWRANSDWGSKLGYDETQLADANRKAISLLLRVREQYETEHTPMLVGGVLGPRGDGYRADARMTAEEAGDYHGAQIDTFAQTDADMVVAYTLNYIEEAIGIALAAQRSGLPVAISFTLETDGRLPSGDSLREAIEQVDQASQGYPLYYMINCAHPTHFEHILSGSGSWIQRIRGLRANASKRSHAELDASPDLDAGNPRELGAQYQVLRTKLPALSIVGGCCGTDHRHIEAICRSVSGRKTPALSA